MLVIPFPPHKSLMDGHNVIHTLSYCLWDTRKSVDPWGRAVRGGEGTEAAHSGWCRERSESVSEKGHFYRNTVVEQRTETGWELASKTGGGRTEPACTGGRSQQRNGGQGTRDRGAAAERPREARGPDQSRREGTQRAD